MCIRDRPKAAGSSESSGDNQLSNGATISVEQQPKGVDDHFETDLTTKPKLDNNESFSTPVSMKATSIIEPLQSENTTAFMDKKPLKNDISFLDNGYYISPSLETLESTSLLDLRHVKNLVVGRKDVGKVEFLKPVDLSNVALNSICEGIIAFEPESFVAFGNYSNPPQIGEGLNVSARVTLYHCYATDKATRKPIKDFNHPLVKRFTANLKKRENSFFENYNPSSGEYTFILDQITA